MSLNGLAHGASLPLFSILQKVEGKTALEALSETREGISSLDLEPHIEVVVVFDDKTIRLNIEPKTDFGALVVEELKARTEFPPCEPGDCELDTQGFCKWCGNISRV